MLVKMCICVFVHLCTCMNAFSLPSPNRIGRFAFSEGILRMRCIG